MASSSSSPPSDKPIEVLFVCLGNICRSTMAEGVFRSIVEKPPYNDLVPEIDSCGTGAYHIGNPPDPRTQATLEAHGITNYLHAARKIHASDFRDFDYIFAMDRDNLKNLKRVQQKAGGKAKLMLFGEFAGNEGVEEVVDPYYGADDGFETAYEQCMRFSKNFLRATFPHVHP